MAVFDQPLLDDWDAAFINEGPLAWVCSQASKPGRPPGPAWVIHATPEWSRANLELTPEHAAARLLEEARGLPGANRPKAVDVSAHRWRYALAEEPLDRQALWFDAHRLALAGDWCAGSRIEGAFLSGMAAAGRVMGSGFAREERVSDETG
jgi:predicted NAD/FAD-dependent oxidoreductase